MAAAEKSELAACLDEGLGLLLGFAPETSESERGSNRPAQPTPVVDAAPAGRLVHVRVGVAGHPGLTLLGVARHDASATLSSQLGELAARIDKLG